MVNLPNNLTVVASGNNIQASGEIAKRSVPIVLQPDDAHPEDRRNFAHPDLRGYVKQQRPFILSCLLGLVENWLAAGRPIHAARMGGFENWSGTVGGILQVNGLSSWRTNEAAWRADADPKGTEMLAFVEQWYATYGGNEVGPADLRKLADEADLFIDLFARHRTDAAARSAFGKMLRRHSDTPVGRWRIRRRRSGTRSLYLLEELVGGTA
jgi:hypothetical protein